MVSIFLSTCSTFLTIIVEIFKLHLFFNETSSRRCKLCLSYLQVVIQRGLHSFHELFLVRAVFVEFFIRHVENILELFADHVSSGHDFILGLFARIFVQKSMCLGHLLLSIWKLVIKVLILDIFVILLFLLLQSLIIFVYFGLYLLRIFLLFQVCPLVIFIFGLRRCGNLRNFGALLKD